MASAAVSNIIIEETEGKKRQIVLSGPALPFKGAAWGGKMGLVTTWYPGNGTRATQQVLGPQEIPSSWEGMWKRTMMGRTPSNYTDETGTEVPVTTPFFLMQALEIILREGAMLKVSWIAQEPSGFTYTLVREGRASDWNFPVDMVTDIAWSITWAWVGRGGSRQVVVALREGDVNSTLASLELQINDVATFNAAMEFGRAKFKQKTNTPKLTLGQLAALAKYPNALATSFTRSLTRSLNTVKEAKDVYDAFRGIPASVKQTFKNFAKNTKSITNNYLRQSSAVPPEQATTSRKPSDVVNTMAFLAQTYQSALQVQRNMETLHGQLQDLETRSGPNNQAVSGGGVNAAQAKMIAVYVTKPGDSPASVSVKFYRNGDNGLAILKANKLPWNLTTFVPGKSLVIPFLSASSGL